MFPICWAIRLFCIRPCLSKYPPNFAEHFEQMLYINKKTLVLTNVWDPFMRYVEIYKHRLLLTLWGLGYRLARRGKDPSRLQVEDIGVYCIGCGVTFNLLFNVYCKCFDTSSLTVEVRTHWSRSICSWDISSFGHFGHGINRPRDMSSKGRVITRDALSKNKHMGTHRSGTHCHGIIHIQVLCILSASQILVGIVRIGYGLIGRKEGTVAPKI
jgi:hypothetical protein